MAEHRGTVRVGGPARQLWLALVALVCVLLSVDAAWAEEPARRFSATFVVTDSQGTRRLPATFGADRYTPLEEARRFRRVLEDGGQPALLAALRGRRDGYLELGGLRAPIALAVATPLDDGAWEYIFVTPRRIRYDEREDGRESADYPFGVAFFEVDSLGRGEGTVHVAATFAIAEDGWLEILDFEGEGRLEDLRVAR